MAAENLQDSSREYAEALKQRLIAEYNEKGLRASGNFEDRIRVRGSRSKGYVLIIPGQGRWIIDFGDGQPGRPPGSLPNISMIEKWIQDKGISIVDSLRRAAFGFAKKIEREGTNIYTGSAQAIDWQQALEDTWQSESDNIADHVVLDAIGSLDAAFKGVDGYKK